MVLTQTYLPFTSIKSKTTHRTHKRNLQMKTRQLQTEPDHDQTLQTANKSPKNAPQRVAALQLQPCKAMSSIHTVSSQAWTLWAGQEDPPCPRAHPALTQHSMEGNFLGGVIGADPTLHCERTERNLTFGSK